MIEIAAIAAWVLGLTLLYIVMLLGVVLIPFGLPGEFLIVIAALVCTLVAGAEVLGWWVFWVLLALGVFAELVEAWAGYLGARQAQGSFWGAVGAIAGGVAGALLGSLFAPVLGSLAGAFAGTFAGAFIVEWYRTRQSEVSAMVARGALVGRVVGSAVKVAVSVLMIIIVTLGLIF